MDGENAVCGYAFPVGIERIRASDSGIVGSCGADKTLAFVGGRDKGTVALVFGYDTDSLTHIHFSFYAVSFLSHTSTPRQTRSDHYNGCQRVSHRAGGPTEPMGQDAVEGVVCTF